MPRSRTLLLAVLALLVVAVPSAVADDNLGLQASFETGSSSAVDLSWDAQPDGSQISLVRDGSVPITPSGPTSATDNVTDGALHSWTLKVDDGAGNVRSQTVTLDADPGPVGHVHATATASEVDLDWTLPADSDIGAVEISRDTHGCASPTLLARVSAPSSSYADTRVSPGTTYCYELVVVDTGGNRSTAVDVSATTDAGGVDTQPPGPVQGLALDDSIVGQLGLSWTNPGDADLAGAVVRRSAASQGCPASESDGVGIPVPASASTPGAGVALADPNVHSGTAYCYAVWAFDSAGNDSASRTATGTAKQSTDSSPPGSVGSLLQYVSRGTSIRLTWTLPTARDLDTVAVRRMADGTRRPACPRSPLEGDAVGGTTIRTSQVDGEARPGRAYCYAVFAIDAAGNASAAAQIRSVIPADVRGVRTAAGCTSGRITWTQPRSPLLVRVMVVRNRLHAPRTPGDGRVRRHHRGGLLDRRLHSHTRYSYRLYTVFRSSNPKQPRTYSAGLVVRLATGTICSPMNGGAVRGRRPRIDWLPRRGAHRYAVRIVHGERTLLVRFPFRSEYRVHAHWRQNGHVRRLRPGRAYQVFVYAYTVSRPDGVLIGQSSFLVRRR